MAKEDVELAEEHIKLAEELVVNESKNCPDNKKKLLQDAAFSLEKAEAELEESE